MSRKLESYPLEILVAGFCSKWKIPLIILDKLEEGLPAPCIVQLPSNKYVILFVNSLSPKSYHIDTITKRKLISPDEYFGPFKLAQLEKSNEKGKR